VTTVGERTGPGAWVLVGRAALVPAAVAAALLPLGDGVAAGNVALVLVAAVAVSAPGRSWWTPLAAATSGAAAFAVLWAPPTGSPTVDRSSHRVSIVLVFAVGLVLARLGQRWRPGRLDLLDSATWRVRQALRRPRGLDCLRSVGRLSEEVACGDSASFIRIDVARTLVELLDLRDCRYETAPYLPSTRPVLQHPGWLTIGPVGWSPVHVGLPEHGFDIVVEARGLPVGRFVCAPRRAGHAHEDSILAALALVDHAAMACLIEAAAAA